MGISSPSLNQTVCALRFFYGVTLNRGEIPERIAYAAGLRVSEAVDIDSDRMLLQGRHGKGAKDRTVMLSAQLLEILRTYWRLTRPTDWLFPGRGERPIDVTVLHSACRSATKAAGLTKKVSMHMLRKVGERTVSGLWDLIGRLVDIFQPAECTNYFKSCGYEPE